MNEKKQAIYDVLDDMSDDDIRSICSQMVSWDGTLSETECDNYCLDDMIDLFSYGSSNELRHFLELFIRGGANLNDDLFWFEYDGIHSAKEGDIEYHFYFDEIVNFLIDNYDGPGFPDYGISDELQNAIEEYINE